jgi:hypothetical protein
MKRLSIILMLAMILGCQSDYELIQGHWHSHESFRSDPLNYMTLDIEDSLIYINKYNKNGESYSGHLYLNNGRLLASIGPYGADYINSNVILLADTLVLLEDVDSLDSNALITFWTRVERNFLDVISDFNSDLRVKINLPIDDSNSSFDSIVNNTIWVMVNIGYPWQNDQEKYGKDTLLLNIYDAFGDFCDIKGLLDAERDLLMDESLDSEFGKIDLIINAHNDTPDRLF